MNALWKELDEKCAPNLYLSVSKHSIARFRVLKEKTLCFYWLRLEA